MSTLACLPVNRLERSPDYDAMPFGWAGGWPSLSLPSLPNISNAAASLLTGQWQRLLLVYLVRRSSAGILLIPPDDIEQSTFLSADLGQGSVELTAVELDVEVCMMVAETWRGRIADGNNQGINAKIRDGLLEHGMQISVRAGRVGKIQVVLGTDTSKSGDAMKSESQIGQSDRSGPQKSGASITERLLNAPIRIKVKDVHIELVLTPAFRQNEDKGKRPASEMPNEPSASIFHVAEDYVQEAVSEAGLADDEDDPFSGLPGGFAASSTIPAAIEQEQAGFIATIIQRLLGRLQLDIRNIRLQIVLLDPKGSPVLPIDVRVAHMSSEAREDKGEQGANFTRSISVETPEIWLEDTSEALAKAKSASTEVLEHPTQEDAQRTPNSEDDLALSVATADLRDSQHQSADTNLKRGSSLYSESSNGEEDASEMFFSTNDAYAAASRMTGSLEQRSLPSMLAKYAPSEQRHQYQIFGLFDKEVTRMRANISVNLVEKRLDSSTLAAGLQISVALPRVAMRISMPILQTGLTWLAYLPSRPPSPAAEPVSRQSQVNDLLIHGTAESVHIGLDLHSGNVDLAHWLERGDSPHSILLHAEAVQAAYKPRDGSGKVAIRTYGVVVTPGRKSALRVIPQASLAWAYDPGRRHSSNPSRSHEAPSSAAYCTVPVLNDAVAIRIRPNNLDITLQPVDIRLNASDLASVQGLIAEVASLGNARVTRATNAHDSPVAAVSSWQVKLAVGCVRTTFDCPNPISQELRAGPLTLDVWDLTLGVAPAMALTMRAHFDLRAPDDLASPVVQLRHLHAFCGDRRQLADAPFLSCLSGVAKESLSLSIDARGEVAHIHIPSIVAALDKTTLEKLQYLADDAGQTIGVLQAQSATTDSHYKNTSAQSLGIALHVGESRSQFSEQPSCDR